MRQLTKYSFVNAKIRAMLSNLISPDLFSRLLEAGSLYEVIDALRTTPYKTIIEEFYKDGSDLTLLEKTLIRSDIHVYKKIASSIPTKREREFVLLLMQRYEIEELKVILRIWNKKNPVYAEDYLIKEDVCFNIDFKKILSARDIEEIIFLLDKTPYKEPLLKVRDKFKEKNSTFYLEMALDIDYYQRLISFVNNLSFVDKKVARKIIGVEVDIENIQWLIRFKKYYDMGVGEILEWFVPGGEKINKENIRGLYNESDLSKIIGDAVFGPYTKVKDLVEKNVHLIEGLLYEVLSREIKKILAGFQFTIGTVLAYFILKRWETKNVVSLIYAKHSGFKKEEILPLLHL